MPEGPSNSSRRPDVSLVVLNHNRCTRFCRGPHCNLPLTKRGCDPAGLTFDLGQRCMCAPGEHLL